MKNLLLVISLIISSSVIAEVKIATVDIQKVLNTVKEGKRATEKLKTSFEKKQKSLKKAELDLKKKQEGLQKKAGLLSKSALGQKQQELQKDFMELQKKSMGYQKEIAKLEAEFKKPIFDKIKVVIDDISKKENVDMTIETSQTPVVYAKSQKDITNDVIKAYDSKHK